MERMAGGQETWAKWKATVLALPGVRAYLSEIENYDPPAIERFLAASGAIAPADWHETEESRAAMDRYYAWEKRVAECDGGSSVLAEHESRSAALPPAQDDAARKAD